MTALVILLAIGCAEPPEACFTIDHTLVDLNETIQFDDCTQPSPKSYFWDFDDGTTSTEANPQHTYTTAGQFLTSLTVRGSSAASEDAISTVIKVGLRNLDSIRINLPLNDPNGQPWDPSDAPDLGLKVLSNGIGLYNFPPLTNFANYRSATIGFNGLNPLPPAPTTIQFYDDDGNGVEQIMGTFSVDLATFVPNASKSVHMTEGNSEITVFYSLR
jgi:hypothetical protein